MAKDPTAFLSDDDLSQDPKLSLSDHQFLHLPSDLPTSPGFLNKARPRNTQFNPQEDIAPGRKRPVKFGADLSSDSSDDDSHPPNVRPWLKQKGSTMSSSSPTLVEEPMPAPYGEYHLDAKLGDSRNNAKVVGAGDVLEYSDYEEDLGGPKAKPGPNEGEAGWTPGFMRRYSSIDGSAGEASSSGSRSVAPVLVPMGAVPATPSLIKALDRISAAQRDAFGPGNMSSSPELPSSNQLYGKKSLAKVDGLPKVQKLDDAGDEDGEEMDKRRAPKWDDFWREVKDKARS
ncbi:hypothetical protein DXG03_004892 [Asterophora parasitica]|uniref:Uncharacterized protein n=1 Tax=Asterophora parasitica TaxID=117018 RepID=A0A9P7GFE3_9AGAR|nr:hypothetical protein DXG03_004892 [Asterophora parasitica]